MSKVVKGQPVFHNVGQEFIICVGVDGLILILQPNIAVLLWKNMFYIVVHQSSVNKWLGIFLGFPFERKSQK